MQKRAEDCRFTIEVEHIIISEYLSGIGGTTLAQKYNCANGTIYNILKAYNITRRSLQDARRNYLNYNVNESVFEEITTPHQAYWLGVMYTDGYLSCTNKYTNFFGLTVHSEDKEWLEKFREFLEYNGNIHGYSGTTSYGEVEYSRLMVGNNKIVKDLINLGVIPNKTKKICAIPNIPFKDDFIRGVVDGDGSIRKKTAYLTISGNKDFLLDIANYLQLPYKIYEDKSIYGLHYKANEAHILERRLYQNSYYYLDRKYNIAKRSFTCPNV